MRCCTAGADLFCTKEGIRSHRSRESKDLKWRQAGSHRLGDEDRMAPEEDREGGSAILLERLGSCCSLPRPCCSS